MDNKKEIVGIYSKGKGDFGFVDVINEEGVKKGYYVFSRNSLNSITGDKVSAKVRIFKGREEAVITKVLERREEPIVGTFKLDKNNRFGFVIPKSDVLGNDIFVAGKNSRNAKDGELVAVKIKSWEKKNPEGTIVKVLGKEGEKGVDILSIALEGGARIGFGDAISKEIQKISEGDLKSELVKRKDLRNLFTITIDGSDSKDLDDAISLEQEGKNYKLYVHIADVAHYVKEDHAIDKEAKRRATSIYLVNKVIPMLPEELSNGLCSLNPNEDKLTLTAEIDINGAGHIVETKVYESVIKSDFRMTYEGVQDILDKESSLPNLRPSAGEKKLQPNLSCQGETRERDNSETLIKTILLTEELRIILRKYKKSLGVLDFDFPEAKIIVDDMGNPTEFKRYERLNSHKIIEEFMVIANEAVSKKFSKLPFLYRVHPKPDEDDLETLQNRLKVFGFNISNLGDINPRNISEVLKQLKGHKSEKLLSKMILRSMTKAIYSDERLGHFGLALEYYSHFTSPIRRYPDLQIHRIIKEQINNKLHPKRLSELKNKLPKIAQKCSDMEVKAEKLEYKVRDLMAVKYMKNKIGEQFEATVSGIIDAGIFVELENTIEGFVELNEKHSSTNLWTMDLEMYKARNIYTDQIITVGDPIKVELKLVDEQLFRLNFALVK